MVTVESESHRLSMETLKNMQTMQLRFNLSRFIIPGLLAWSLVQPCFALDLEPRQWSHLPVGANFAGFGYAYTKADIAFDPVLLLEDVQMDLKTWVGKYIRTFEVFDKSARIDLTQAYQQGDWTGLLNGSPASTSRSGWSDSYVRLAVNLYGAPPLRGKAFAAYRSGVKDDTIIGMGLVVRLPTGEYMDDKLINLGQNRFTFRPQIGINHTHGKWTAEVTGEVAFYTDNDEFFNGNTLEQKPTYIVHGHLIHTFRPGLWVGASVGYDYGGESTINGIEKDDSKQDVAWALSLACPINRYSGLKFTYIGSRKLESTGLDSDTLAASLSLSW
jgi:Putative MetA-pathway of phenol degradation